MAEKVLIASVRNPNRAVLVDVRIARALVARGSFGYVTEQVTAEPAEEPKKATKKRTYKRRDMKAEG
jgi:hypothetical protein